MRSLQIGESAYVLVRAEVMWNGSDLLVRKGEHYRFSTRNLWYWYDDDVASNADGQIKVPRLLRLIPDALKRCNEARWYALVGSVGKKTHNQFIVGSGKDNVEMPANGELLFFANDTRVSYSNNHGQLRLDIERVG